MYQISIKIIIKIISKTSILHEDFHIKRAPSKIICKVGLYLFEFWIV